MSFQLPIPALQQQSPVLAVHEDIIYTILAKVSPHDVLVLRETARVFRQTIDGLQSISVWQKAFTNVGFVFPNGTLPLLPAQIAQIAFGGGACHDCGAFTLAVPHSFTLGIRFCSLVCEYVTLGKVPPSLSSAPSLPPLYPDLEAHNTLPWAIPYLEGTKARPLYKRTHVNAAWTQWRQSVAQSVAAGTTTAPVLPKVMPSWSVSDPAVEAWMEAGAVLSAGAKDYRLKQDQVEHHNYAQLQILAASLALTMEQVTASPTLAREMRTLARDLQTLDGQVWNIIRLKVVAELLQRVSVNGTELPCPFCPTTRPGRPRMYREDALRSHIHRIHPDEEAEHIKIPGSHRCTLCPSTDNSLYDRASLFRHVHRRR
ncbi:hypothetical protein B0H16DRAFT_1702117 [Mycena metata]|uniref:Uncharacterized protein n=1 Tax=Mycena metata TaxID=1033252 RepID=A0AAD7MEV2_9AGAR|nr:hypothetical protein B0H16DRAFT_1702117 [Mycena metata]